MNKKGTKKRNVEIVIYLVLREHDLAMVFFRSIIDGYEMASITP